MRILTVSLLAVVLSGGQAACKVRTSSAAGSHLASDPAAESGLAAPQRAFPDQTMDLQMCLDAPDDAAQPNDFSLNGSNIACKCDALTVKCAEPSIAGAGAQCNQRTCVVTISADYCRLLGLSTDDALPTAFAISNPLLPELTQRGTLPSNSSVYGRCAILHEAKHACDGRGLSSCMSERNAYIVSIECIRAFQAKYCKPIADGAEDLCRYLQVIVTDMVQSENYQVCKCNGGSAATCADQCALNYPAHKSDCAELAALYPD